MKRGLIFFVLILGFISVITILPKQYVEASCGASISSCKSCHEIKKEYPVLQSGAWHQDHAFGDFCESCHGGHSSAQDVERAHADMVDPLADVESSCGGFCHDGDLEQRAGAYGVSLISGENSGEEPKVINEDISNPVPQENQGQSKTGNTVLAFLNIGVLGILGLLIWKYEFRQKM